MTFIIAGMHRSGTSMVARLLNLCGVYLGDEKDLTPSAADNTEGFWENVQFQNINDEILASFGGSWDCPPMLEPGWEKSTHLLEIRNRVDNLINEFSSHRIWSWKDPRNSLTLPYWKTHFPDLKVVICLRNPYDVFNSLSRRSYASSTFSYNLWCKYYEGLLAATHPQDRIVTHFESYFSNPQLELRILLNFLNIDASEAMIQTACSTISTDLRHSHGSISQLLKTNAPANLLKIYKDLCYQAGSVFGSIITPEEREFFANINPNVDVNLKDYERLVTTLKLQIRHLEDQMPQVNKEIFRLQNELNEIYKSRSWKLIEKTRKLKSAILFGRGNKSV